MSVAAGVGTGGLIKSNQTSSDNTLAFPIGPGTITYKKPNRPQALNTNNNNNSTKNNNNSNAGSTQVAGGGSILKSNNTSSDNPLSQTNNTAINDYNSYESMPMPSEAAAAANNNNNSNPSSRTNVFPPAEAYRRTNQPSPSSFEARLPPPQPMSTYQPPPPQQQQSMMGGGYYSAPMPQMYSAPSENLNYDMYPKTAMNMPSPRDMNMTMTNNEAAAAAGKRDIRFDVDHTNKQAYKRALDQQVAEKEIMKYNEQKAKLRSERDVLKQYPFGRRTDLSSMVAPPPDDVPAMYEPSFYSNNTRIGAGAGAGAGGTNPLEQPMRFLNKDNIVEKPNSLSADIPPYDPIKHRNGFHQGFNYDPWGKPGSGAPLIDANTGRKFTKYSGQVWYDTIGLSPDDRAKAYSDRNRPLTLEEQRRDMEVEKQRRQYEEAVYKSRAGDVATWITEIEKQRNKYRMYGAHLPHTNVTRDKINLEYARRFADMKARNYHDELGAQLEERQRSKMLHKLKEDVAGIEHTRKWDDWWGKPGGGAPNTTLRRHDISGTLESPRGNADGSATSLPIGAQQDGVLQPDGSLLFTKGTLRSSHRNLYDNMQEMKL